MQFTVLIEFLIPGLVTVLLGLALLAPATLSSLRGAVPTGDAAAALLLLAVSYPIGHLVNFPVFQWIQRPLLTPRIRRDIVERYRKLDLPLEARASQRLGVPVGANSQQEIEQLFGYIQAIAFSANIAQLNANDLFYKSLERLARGMLFPSLLAIYVIWRNKILEGWPLGVVIIVLFGLFIVSFLLLRYSLKQKEDEIARFFLAVTAKQETPPAPSNNTAGGVRTEG
jgi:hypothetical protein